MVMSDPDIDAFIEAAMRKRREARAARVEDLLDAYEGKVARPPWSSLAEMNAALQKQREAQKPKPIDKDRRRAEIQRELDIIRGILPTPAGYTVDPDNIKRLMTELRNLGGDES